MIKKSVTVTIIFIASTVIQLLSQIVVTRMFGARLELDIFLAAVAIPTIMVTVIYGTLNDAFLPLYAERLIKNKKDSDEYFFSSMIILVCISLLSVLFFIFFSQPLSYLLYSDKGIIFVQKVSMQMQYMSLSIPFSIIATLCGVYFYIRKKFNRFPIAQFIGSIVNLLLIILLAPLIGNISLVLAFVLNIVFQIVFVIPKLNLKQFTKEGFLKKWGINTKQIAIAWIPLVIGSFAMRSDILLVRSFAAKLPEGYFVYLNLVYKIFTLATGIMTIGIQAVLLPHLVDNFVQKKYQLAMERIKKSKIIAALLSLFVGISILLIGPIFIQLLFIGGKFSYNDAQIAKSLLPFFLLTGIGWGISGVFFQPLLAIKKNWPISILNVCSLFIGWFVGQIIYNFSGPLYGISWGLSTLLFTGIIGSELLWQYYKKSFIKK